MTTCSNEGSVLREKLDIGNENNGLLVWLIRKGYLWIRIGKYKNPNKNMCKGYELVITKERVFTRNIKVKSDSLKMEETKIKRSVIDWTFVSLPDL